MGSTRQQLLGDGIHRPVSLCEPVLPHIFRRHVRIGTSELRRAAQEKRKPMLRLLDKLPGDALRPCAKADNPLHVQTLVDVIHGGSESVGIASEGIVNS